MVNEYTICVSMGILSHELSAYTHTHNHTWLALGKNTFSTYTVYQIGKDGKKGIKKTITTRIKHTQHTHTFNEKCESHFIEHIETF